MRAVVGRSCGPDDAAGGSARRGRGAIPWGLALLVILLGSWGEGGGAALNVAEDGAGGGAGGEGGGCEVVVQPGDGMVFLDEPVVLFVAVGGCSEEEAAASSPPGGEAAASSPLEEGSEARLRVALEPGGRSFSWTFDGGVGEAVHSEPQDFS
ncbi:hypothetical protein T484DRAFT_1921481 [Baffinella frigidus]|nr:hypothetical protein T484DRAFT_1921481 [Cryptophyta sp. CCMP2293]